MRIINKLVSILLVLCLLIITSMNEGVIQIAFAQEIEKNQSTTINAEQIYDFNNSELDVRVVRQTGNEQTTVFTGKLKDYDNGSWVHFDFSDIQFCVIFSWDETDDTIYIIPVGNQPNISDDTETVFPSTADLNESMSNNTASMSQNTNIKCDVNLMYDGAYSEKVIIRNKQLTVPVKITNDGISDKNIVCYIAEYDENGTLYRLYDGGAKPQRIRGTLKKVKKNECKSVTHYCNCYRHKRFERNK